MDASTSVATETVYWALDGGIHHAKCSQRMVLTRRTAQELSFSCLACIESVRLPLATLMRVPIAT